MEAKTNGRVQRSAAEWQEILSRFGPRGRSRAAFCWAEGITPATIQVAEYFESPAGLLPSSPRRCMLTYPAAHPFGRTGMVAIRVLPITEEITDNGKVPE